MAGGISPWRVGRTAPIWTLPITDDTGAAVNLTGATGWTLTITEQETGVQRTGAGTFTVTNATGGIVTYAWAAADVAKAGSFTLVVSWTTSAGTVQDIDPLVWLVKPVGQL